MDLVDVGEAAQRLGLHPAHVRRLVREGIISGRKIAGRWVVDDAELRRHRRMLPSAGRPVSPEMAWILLRLVDAELHAPGERERLRSALESSGVLGDRKLRYRLRRLLDEAPPVEQWASWLRRRASARRIWVHAGVAEHFSEDRRVHPSAVGAEVAGDAEVIAGFGGSDVFYVREADVEAVARDYHVLDDVDGSVVLMVIPEEVSEALLPDAGSPVPASGALLDWLSSTDARERHFAVSSLGRGTANARTSLRPQ